MVVVGGPARGIRAAVMAAPKMTAPKISTDIIPIITSNCFYDGPHPTSLLPPWVWFNLGWNGAFILGQSDGSFGCAGFSWTVLQDLRLALRGLLDFPLGWTGFS